ncbi:MAG: helix-turn-helix transcriptional regulator [Anaerolineales bacterium]|nr:helix-turn-helix transcriptional regulator [Anaerolineales bacterium]
MPVERTQEKQAPSGARQPAQRWPRQAALEPIGKRIARLRCEGGWTQQAMAARLAISRVAVSHIEMELTFPSERTITLLAGIFKLSPHELVEGSTYPPAKAERLPAAACCYTQLELELALLENDLAWLARLNGPPEGRRLASELQENWNTRLSDWLRGTFDERERGMLVAAQERLAEACE